MNISPADLVFQTQRESNIPKTVLLILRGYFDFKNSVIILTCNTTLTSKFFVRRFIQFFSFLVLYPYTAVRVYIYIYIQLKGDTAPLVYTTIDMLDLTCTFKIY